MSQRYPGGLITKTPVTPSGPTGTNTAPGVWTIEQALEYQKAGNWPSSAGAIDSNFEYVTMLLPGNGTNGAQNNTFLDSSTNNFTITRNGNTTQGTFSPYGDNWSNYFDGTGDYLQTSSGTTLGTGDFTVEAWVFNTTSGQKPEIWINGGQVGQFVVSTNFNAADAGVILGALSPAGSGWSVALAGSTALTANTWNHIAWVRASGVITVYLNGVAGGTYSNSSNSISLGRIGAFDSSNYDLNGYISNLRVVAGTAVYTANFTPPTSPLTAITNTSLLTCQSNRFRDASTNNFTITVNGNTSVQRFSPFSPTASYSAATIGGSGYFDGSGDYLTVPDNAALQMGSGNFTIEYWWYPNNITSYQSPVDKGYTGAGALLLQTGDGDGRIIVYASGSAVITSSTAVAVNAWNHMALVRSGTTLTLYQNGASVGSATNSTNFNNTATLGIGANATAPGGGAVGAFPIVGYLSNVRFVKGTAVYSGSTYTIPSSPLAAITNTSLLLNFTNGGIIDNAMMNDLETVGNAQISTTQSKFGGSSMYFDGTGDRLVGVNTPNLNFGSGPWTIEFWIYATDQVIGPIVNQCSQSASAGWGVWAYNGSTGTSRRLTVFLNGLNFLLTTAADAWASNTWTHIAVVKSGTNLTVYANGTSVATSSSAPSSITDTTAPPMIGATVSGVNWGVSYDFNGYIDDLRITKGIARYTANFTPPTAAFPTR